MKFVPVKPIERQDIQSQHKIRAQLISSRIRAGNHTRGLLSEYGLIARSGFKFLHLLIQDAIESESLTPVIKEEVPSIYEELLDLNDRLERINKKQPFLSNIFSVVYW